MNGTQYNMLASPPNMPDMTITLSGAMAHIMRNNIGYPNKNTNMTGVDSMFNSWDLMITPAGSDFASIADPSVSMTGMSIEGMGALGPRQADGSLPDVDFLKLAAMSRMIDKGTDVGLPFVGAAPDLGAYEYGAAASTATGGAGGTTTPGTGGTGSGGSRTGGSSGAAGAAGKGGAIGGPGGTPGSTGTGGMASPSGGTTGLGGTGGHQATASGGASGQTSGTGGATILGTGGVPTGSGGATGGPTAGDASIGCSCAFDRGPEGTMLGLLVSALGMFVARRRRPR